MGRKSNGILFSKINLKLGWTLTSFCFYWKHTLFYNSRQAFYNKNCDGLVLGPPRGKHYILFQFQSAQAMIYQ